MRHLKTFEGFSAKVAQIDADLAAAQAAIDAFIEARHNQETLKVSRFLRENEKVRDISLCSFCKEVVRKEDLYIGRVESEDNNWYLERFCSKACYEAFLERLRALDADHKEFCEDLEAGERDGRCSHSRLGPYGELLVLHEEEFDEAA